MADKVRCADCGYLALRMESSRDIREAEPSFRKNGEALRVYDFFPLCFTNSKELTRECQEFCDGGKSGEHPIHRQRTCNGFVKWIPGRSPKETQDMVDAEMQRRQQTNDNRINLAVAIVGPFLVSLFAAWLNNAPSIVIQAMPGGTVIQQPMQPIDSVKGNVKAIEPKQAGAL